MIETIVITYRVRERPNMACDHCKLETRDKAKWALHIALKLWHWHVESTKQVHTRKFYEILGPVL